MISVMASKWVADAFGLDGIYPAWIALRQYPWLPPTSRTFRDGGETAVHTMRPAARLVVVRDACALGELQRLAREHPYRAFPVVRGERLLGVVMRDKLRVCVGECSLSSW